MSNEDRANLANEVAELGAQISDLASDLDWVFDECDDEEFEEARTILRQLTDLAEIAASRVEEGIYDDE